VFNLGWIDLLPGVSALRFDGLHGTTSQKFFSTDFRADSDVCRRAMDLDLNVSQPRSAGADWAEALALICLDPISASARADRAEALEPAVAAELVGIASLCASAPKWSYRRAVTVPVSDRP
jgi:hypothetical protein